MSLIAAAAGAASAQAAEKLTELEVTATNPVSSEAAPASSTTPLVIGHEKGGTTTAIRPGGHWGRAIAAAVAIGEEVALYTAPGCGSAPVATGSLNELEGSGIQVEVPADSLTVFYARQFDPSEVKEPSTCSKTGYPYWESSTGVAPSKEPPVEELPTEKQSPPTNPPAPLHVRTQPSGRANDNTPRILGSAPGAERVKLFTNTSCSGAPVANVSAFEFASGVSVHVPDNSITDFTGVAVANGKQSFCSPPATYIEDSSPPRTRITMGPGAKTRRHKAVFRFADTGEDPLATAFQCKVNHGKWKPCHSPLRLRHLGFHRYVLRVRGTDEIGNAETKPAKRSFKVIR